MSLLVVFAASARAQHQPPERGWASGKRLAAPAERLAVPLGPGPELRRLPLPFTREELTRPVQGLRGPFSAAAGQQPARISPQPLADDYYTRHFGFFCQKELMIEKTTRIPLRFRLGSLDYCNSLEGKR